MSLQATPNALRTYFTYHTGLALLS